MNALTGQLENLYGFLGLIGFISFALIGMLYKIVPFLVWFATYSKSVGFAKVPSLADLYCERLQIIGYFSFLAGVTVVSGGIATSSPAVIRLGGVLLLGSLFTLVLNVGRMLMHFLRPKSEPLAVARTATK
jgi:hypothetical protein